MLRKLLIGVGILLAVLVIAAVAVVAFVDVNRFKPQIEQFVQDRYQRTLRIGGDLGLSLFPRLALSLPPSSLSEPGGAGEAASLESAKVSVAVMPLLRGQLIADKLTVAGLKAAIERRADGSLSIDDLIGKGPSGPAAPTAPADPSGGLPQLDIGGIELTDAQVVFRDLQSKNTATVSGLELKTGRIANQGETPIELKFAFASTNPEAKGELSLKGDAQLDLDRNLFGARNLSSSAKIVSGRSVLDAAELKLAGLSVDPARMTVDLSGLEVDANGKLEAGAFEARLAAPRLALTETSASGETLRATVKLTGSQAVDARIEASGIGGTTQALTVASLALDATARQGERVVQARLATPVRADVPGGVFELAGLAGTVVIQDPAIPGKSATIDLKGTASADMQKESLKAQLDAKAQDTSLAARLDMNGFEKPKVGFDVTADKLDVDRYFPPQPAPAAGAPAGGGATGTPGSAGAPADTPVDLSALADLHLDGKVGIGQLVARGIKVSDLRVTMKAAGGKLAVVPVTAALYGGKLAATANVQAGANPAGNRIDAGADLSGVSIGPLLRDVADKDMLEGQGNVKLKLSGDGGTVGAIKRSLDGTAALNLHNGAIKGINLGETIRNTRNLLQGGGKPETKASDSTQKTDFTELGISFVIKDGIATSNDLDVKSPLLRIGGEGRADLVAGTLDYTVRASVVATSTGQGGKELERVRGVTIPVRLTGPFDQLAWQIDWETAGKEALKGRAKEELQRRLGTDDLEGKAKEKALDALKGLFKR
jgi:AsmA protein